MSVPVDEDLLAALLVVLREGAVDGAFLQGERPAVRVGVVHDVVQRAVAGEHLGERPAGQLLGGAIHVDAVLPVIHQEDRHGGVVQDRVETALGLEQLAAPRRRLTNGALAAAFDCSGCREFGTGTTFRAG